MLARALSRESGPLVRLLRGFLHRRVGRFFHVRLERQLAARSAELRQIAHEPAALSSTVTMLHLRFLLDEIWGATGGWPPPPRQTLSGERAAHAGHS